MADDFDPYFKWLAIPAREQPPNHYRLLGLPLYASDPEVIQNATDQRMAHLRTMQIGPRGPLAEKLLNEISAARLCLLNPTQRALYDAKLHALEPREPATYASLGIDTTAPPRLPPVSPPLQLRQGVSQVACPHCGLGMLNDGSMAGNVVACASCCQPFAMPAGELAASFPDAVTLPASPPLVENVEQHPPVTLRRTTRRQPPPGLNVPIVILGGIAGIAIALLIIWYLYPEWFRERFRTESAPSRSTDSSASAPTPAANPMRADEVGRFPPIDGTAAKQPALNHGMADAVGNFESATVSQSPPPPPSPTVNLDPSPDVNSSGSIFSGLAEFWQLPPLTQSEALKVASLGEEPAEVLEVALETERAAIPANSLYYCEPGPDGVSWQFRFSADADRKQSLPIGTLRRDQRDLSFSWTLPESDEVPPRSQLQNCVVSLRHGKDIHSVQLREPLLRPPLVLDLQKGVQFAEFMVEDLPEIGELQWKMRLDEFAFGARTKDSTDSIAVGKQSQIEFIEMPGAVIGIRFLYVPARKVLAIRMESLFYPSPARKFPLTVAELQERQQALHKSLEKARKDLKVALRELESARAELMNLLAAAPSTPQGEQTWKPRVARQTSIVELLTKRVTALHKRIDRDIPGDLEEVARLQPMVAALHATATISFAVVADGKEKQIVLVNGGLFDTFRE